MDQIFDRLNTLFKSLLNDDPSDSDDFDSTDASGAGAFARQHYRPGVNRDSDFDAAMDELDDFLNEGRGSSSTSGKTSNHYDREQQSEQRNYNQYSQSRNEKPLKLQAAYKLLGLPYGTNLAESKKAWKNLLKEHHPDKHASDPEAYRKATERCGRINDAYRIIETWHEHGHLADE